MASALEKLVSDSASTSWRDVIKNDASVPKKLEDQLSMNDEYVIGPLRQRLKLVDVDGVLS